MACGGEFLRPDSPVGFVVTPDRCFVLTPSDDVERIRQEELRGLSIDIVPVATLGVDALVARARDLMPPATRWKCDTPGLAFDVDRSVDLLRRTLGPEETERLRKLALEATHAVEEVATECYRGILERDAAARLASECVRRQMVPRVILAGADERLDQYPRPYPKGTAAERVLGLTLLSSRGGLHVVVSRTICLVSPPDSLLDRFDTLARFAAGLCHAARDGESLGRVVQSVLPPSIHTGSPGGVVGYAFPEEEARPGSEWKLTAGQALAWTLTMGSARCEETMLLESSGPKLLTTTEDWPRRSIQLDGATYDVADLLQL